MGEDSNTVTFSDVSTGNKANIRKCSTVIFSTFLEILMSTAVLSSGDFVLKHSDTSCLTPTHTKSHTHIHIFSCRPAMISSWHCGRCEETHTHTRTDECTKPYMFFFFLINIPICVHMFKGRVNRQIHSQKWVYSETFCLHLPWPYVRLHGLLMGDI